MESTHSLQRTNLWNFQLVYARTTAFLDKTLRNLVRPCEFCFILAYLKLSVFWITMQFLAIWSYGDGYPPSFVLAYFCFHMHTEYSRRHNSEIPERRPHHRRR